MLLADPERRTVDVHDDAGTAMSKLVDRTVGNPRVLADRDADRHTGDLEELERPVPRTEMPHLVEHVVIGKVTLVVGAVDLAARTHGRCVPDAVGAAVARTIGETDDRRTAAGSGGELLERRTDIADESRLEHEILGRIARDRHLGQQDEIGVGRLGLLDHGEGLGDVAVEISDGRIELGDRNAKRVGHLFTLRRGPATNCFAPPSRSAHHQGGAVRVRRAPR